MAIIVGTNSWVTLAEANSYFAERYAVNVSWDALDDPSKEAALITAYKQLTQSNLYSFPTTSTQIMKDMQCEQAIFLVIQGDALDRRIGLQAQGVLEAGIVKEKYDKNMRGKISIAPIVQEVFKNNDYEIYGANLYIQELERTEN